MLKNLDNSKRCARQEALLGPRSVRLLDDAALVLLSVRVDVPDVAVEVAPVLLRFQGLKIRFAST